MLTTEQILERIEAETGGIYFDLKPRSLFEPIEYTLSLGGKRIRPVMTLLACNAFSDNIDAAVKPALGMEVFHNFTLLHDDLMDQADKRRNKLTVHKKWNTNTAILSGDAMMIAAYQLIGETGEPHLKRILDLFSVTAMEICCGQQYDMEFEQRDTVAENDYIEMIRLKTAVLIACCLKTGAIVGGASEAEASKLYDAGLNIGLAFQIQDDMLDVYGDTDTFGKNIGGDILCNKKTYLLIKAYELADSKQKETMEWYKNPANSFTPQEKISAYTDIYNALCIRDIAQSRIDGFFKLAMRDIDSPEVGRSNLKELKRFANMLMLRES